MKANVRITKRVSSREETCAGMHRPPKTNDPKPQMTEDRDGLPATLVTIPNAGLLSSAPASAKRTQSI